MNNIAFLDNSNQLDLNHESEQQLHNYFDEKYRTSWCYMQGLPRPCFTPDLLKGFQKYITMIKKEMAETNGEKYDFVVVASDVEGIFNLGGDLALFKQCIEEGRKEELLTYAISCIDVLYANMTHLEQNLTTISLVQGDALGGGFEAALASNVLVAEKGVKMGLPEVLFNLFPGMGAFSFLSRKVGAALAEQIILSGKLYTSDELYQMGIVDVLAEKNDGESAVYEYIKTVSRQSNSYQALRKVKDVCNPITYKELVDITKIWVDAAFNLTDRDLKIMNRLIRRQNSLA